MSLRPCTSCRRLVRAADAQCPFCSAEADPLEPRAAEPFQRRARAALLVGALAVAGTACAKESTAVAVYGGPPPEMADAGPPAVTPEPLPPPAATADAGHASVEPRPPPTGPVTMYGAPPLPTHSATAHPTPRPTAPVAAYGAAPMPGPKP